MNDAQCNENQDNQDQPEQEQRVPLGHSLSYGAGTFVAAGIVDLLAHLGPTGLVVGGVAAWVASQHGPELIEQVREAFASSPVAPLTPQQAENAHEPPRRGNGNSTRSVLDRALGRFPVQERENALLEDVDTILIEEPETPVEPIRQAQRSAMQITHPIRLSRELVLEANEIVGAGINIFGVKGSGKTGTVARLAEQFARYQVSEVLFEIKGDLDTLVTDRREDGRPYVPHGFVGVRGHAPRGRSILRSGLQVVYDLRTWQTPGTDGEHHLCHRGRTT